jgi:shikimate kinase
MGAGKTTVGRILASRLGVPFVDLDDAVTAAAGATVPEIFEREGEGGFREREVRALESLLGGDPAVIALGGGTLSRPDTREALRGRATLVYLRTGEDELRRRLAATDPATRPLLAGGFPEELLRRREAVYATCDVVVDTDRLDPSAVADRIARLLRDPR